MNAVVSAEIEIKATDGTGPGLSSVQRRLRDIEKTAKAVDRVQSVAMRTAHVNRQVAAVRRVQEAYHAAEASALGYGRVMGGAAVAAFGADALRSAASFETALTNIQKKGDLSAESLEGVKREILGLVESGKVAMSPGEIAAGYERGMAAGIPLAELKEFVLLTTQAADAWEMTGQESGNAFAGFRESLKLTAGQIRPYADLINTLADAGISDESDIVKFIDRTGASLKGLGLSNQNIAALGGTLLDLKVPAEEAATSMNALSTKLLTPDGTKASAAAFREMYGSVDAFKDLLTKDANGAVRDFLDRLSQLDNFRRTSILSDIIGQEHTPKINRLIASLDLLDQRVALANDPSRYVGSLGKSYDLKLKTLEAKWDVFKANFEKAKIDLGSLVIAPAGDFLGEATKAVNDFSSAITGAKGVYDTLASALTGRAAPGDFDSKGFNIFDPWGNRARLEADAHGSRSVALLLEKSGGSGAAGAFGARDMDGVTSGKALAYARNVARRVGSAEETPAEARETDASTEYFRGVLDRADAHNRARLDAVNGGRGPRVGRAPDPERFGDDTIAVEGADELRHAMEAGGQSLTQSGMDAARAISEAAKDLRGAAQAIGEQGRAAAAAISSAKIPIPTMRPGAPALANANLGRSMPDAGKPGD